MTEFPVPLDNLIAYVKALHPEGGPLANVSDAFAVSTQLDEQADALIGYFVDRARVSGLSWSQIGGAMGVSKQAAQKRFVPTKAGDLLDGRGKPFDRFTARARVSPRRRIRWAARPSRPPCPPSRTASPPWSSPSRACFPSTFTPPSAPAPPSGRRTPARPNCSTGPSTRAPRTRSRAR